jgi:hypothetical protein
LNIPRFISITFTLLVSCWVPISSGQVAKDGPDARFHDDLLDHMVGQWVVDVNVYGHKFTSDRQVEWVLGHQYLRIQEKSREVVPWLKKQFERVMYIGYNHGRKRYVVYELNVHGADVPTEPEGFTYASRSGNELTVDHKNGAEVLGRSRLVWDPSSRTWLMQSWRVIGGKDQPPHANLIAVAVKPAANEAQLPNR